MAGKPRGLQKGPTLLENLPAYIVTGHRLRLLRPLRTEKGDRRNERIINKRIINKRKWAGFV